MFWHKRYFEHAMKPVTMIIQKACKDLTEQYSYFKDWTHLCVNPEWYSAQFDTECT